MKRSSLGVAGIAGLAVAGMSIRWGARRLKRLDLRGQVAVVTGGGRGLGLAITRELVRHGCRVAICGRDGRVIGEAVRDLAARGADVFGEAADMTQPEDASTFIENVLAYYGRIDLLVNNAAECFVGPAVELQPRDVEHALRSIFWAQYYPTMAVLPHLRARRFGRIANVTSIGGKLPIPHQAAYVAGKYAATGWSQTLAIELANENIQVSTITPPPLRNGAPLHVHYNGAETEEEFVWFTRTLTSRLTGSSADRTARVVVDALAHGDRERAVTLGSWLLSRSYGAFPNALSRFLTSVEGRLPAAAPPGVTSRMRLGADIVRSSSDATVHALADRASQQEARYLPTRALPK